MLEFLPLGLDYNSGVYRVVNEEGTPYLLKVKSRSLYEPSYLVPRYLREQGIASVVAPLHTKSRALWSWLGVLAGSLYPFLQGDTSWTGMADEHWKKVGTICKQIHQVTLPPSGFESLRKETFDPTEYIRWVHAFETQHTHSQCCRSASQRALCSSWLAHQSKIHTGVTALEQLAGVLQGRTFSHVICHGDLHPGNLLRDPASHVFVIDWDEVILAPKERDFIYIKELQTTGLVQQDSSPFFQGYGPTEIDWMALMYYRWERVIQDLIACAQNVCLRDDLGEETKMDAFQLFHEILTGGDDIDVTYAAASHIPSNLSFHTRINSKGHLVVSS